jgi:Ca2+-binding EF-hand superfamily protein
LARSLAERPTILKDLLLRVDIDGSGQLDLREFCKVIRQIIGREQELLKLAFEEAPKRALLRMGSMKSMRHLKTVKADGGHISVEQAMASLMRVGAVDRDTGKCEILAEEKTANGQVDYYGFCHAAARIRAKQQAEFKQNGGFGRKELATMRERFDEYDVDKSGAISNKEIALFVTKEFPQFHNDPTMRPQIVQFLDEADEDKNGALEFHDFLRVMRLIIDVWEQIRIEKELEAIHESSFSLKETEEFRQLFEGSGGDVTGEIAFDQVKSLLSCIVPMGFKNTAELKMIYDEQAAKQMGVDGSEDMMDFPEFLLLMRELLDCNWANIANRTSALAPDDP